MARHPELTILRWHQTTLARALTPPRAGVCDWSRDRLVVSATLADGSRVVVHHEH